MHPATLHKIAQALNAMPFGAGITPKRSELMKIEDSDDLVDLLADYLPKLQARLEQHTQRYNQAESDLLKLQHDRDAVRRFFGADMTPAAVR
ncbi:hypothetical protein PBI_KRATIO_72 [Mycobacterium phage Kratio]|uniref:Uncharacterized protein n=1 Tax=Mycobacterium phage Kratio TaxID=1606763 RepID=A0A0C5AAM7_9CAUD|nr:hypothetical protein PBI_KRATIO_72 [Mycobacterium phage Kratio]AJK27401.1 hypothetical protein PBI_KRATIO_72 [Mycobacterium phage Kratio]